MAQDGKLEQSFRDVCAKNGLTHFNIGFNVDSDSGYAFAAFAHRGSEVAIGYGDTVEAALSCAIAELKPNVALADMPLVQALS